ncbi:unnamed protein product [Cylicocyclus nassatus]|uniref:Uncharacterized protein n=1 Tax=Cylicocyclus nassatus TaxID=53992 RepID=A0AA36DUQ4_CYLNA|nr:unnamed protein product [Cylicocyclus nassatus]
MQSLAKTVLSGLRDTYIAVFTATDAVATDKARTKPNEPEIDMPVNLPPYNRTEYPDVRPDASKLGSCMLYSEGINIVGRNAKKEFVSIPVRSLTNHLGVILLEMSAVSVPQLDPMSSLSGSPIEFKLVFNGTSGGFWMLTDVVANNVAVQGNGKGFIPGSAKADTKVIFRPSVNNVDDDPKHKQIVINVRE